MTFRQIQAFLLVVRTGSIAAAANHMGLTQSGVSRLVTELSRNVGFELFSRVGRGVQPTARGAAFFKSAESAFKSAEALQRVAQDIREGFEDRVRLACLPTLSSTVLPGALEIFFKKYPNVFIDIYPYHPSEIIVALNERRIDLALSFNLPKMEGVWSERMAKARYIFAAHENHPLAKLSIVTDKDLEGHDLIGFTGDSILLPNEEEDLVIGKVVNKVNRRLWCQTSVTRYALLSNQKTVNIAEPFSFPLFKPHGIVMRPYEPKVEAEYCFVMPLENKDSPISIYLRRAFREAIKSYARMHKLPVTVLNEK